MPLAPQAAPPSTAPLRGSRRLLTLEHFCTPYQVGDCETLAGLDYVQAGRTGGALIWPGRSPERDRPQAATLGSPQAPEIPIFARITPDVAARSLLAKRGGKWAPTDVAVTVGGERVASIWREDGGSVFLPFDPDEVRLACLSEGYQAIARRGGRDWKRVARTGYYRARGLMPRAAQIWLRRRYARIQARAAFPRWPVETGLHDFLELVFHYLQSIAGEPLPRIAPWPNGHSWALVLTHDVETATGLSAVDSVAAVERSLGLRSSWNFVPRRYHVGSEQARDMALEGFEVGVHGLYHDGRDLESISILRERLPAMRAAADRWNAVGFRAPATQRDWELMPMLGFDYDSSYPDTDPFEPQSGGCCTWLPFFNREMVELPLTMPQDHTLFVILRQKGERAWVRKAEFLRAHEGMALLDTHPDYLLDPEILGAYRGFLERFAEDDRAWKALPREVSSWWRRRAQSRLEWTQAGWTITGPAAGEARVELVPVKWGDR